MANFLAILVLIISTLFLPIQVTAANESGKSAHLYETVVNTDDNLLFEKYIKLNVIREVLKVKQSPLLNDAAFFISVCLEYEIDCYLLPSISGLESSFGKKLVPGSHNPFGWGGGYIKFDSWQESFDSVAREIKNIYYDRGATTINEIAPIYAESDNWAPRVSNIYEQFEKKEREIHNLAWYNLLQL